MYTLNPGANTSLRLINAKKVPIVAVTPLAMGKMQSYVSLCSMEVSWMGHISVENGVHVIDDVFLIDQEVAAATCSFTEEGLSKFMVDMIQEKGIDYYNEICVWGHSHVNMPTSPSAQDEKQILEWKDRDYFIMLILNKRGDVHCEFYDFKNNIAYRSLPVQMFVPNHDQIHQQAQKDIKAFVRQPKPNPRGFYSGYGNAAIKDTASKARVAGRQISMDLRGATEKEQVVTPIFRAYLCDCIKDGHDLKNLLFDEIDNEAGGDLSYLPWAEGFEEYLLRLPETTHFNDDEEGQSEVFINDVMKEMGCQPDWMLRTDKVIEEFLDGISYVKNTEKSAVSALKKIMKDVDAETLDYALKSNSIGTFMTRIDADTKSGKQKNIHTQIMEAMTRTLRQTALWPKEVVAIFADAAELF